MNDFAVFLVSRWQIVLIVWGISLLLCTHIGMRRGFPVMGFLNGLVMGPLGLLNVITTGDQTRQPCTACAEDIKKAAKVCPHCGASVG